MSARHGYGWQCFLCGERGGVYGSMADADAGLYAHRKTECAKFLAALSEESRQRLRDEANASFGAAIGWRTQQ